MNINPLQKYFIQDALLGSRNTLALVSKTPTIAVLWSNLQEEIEIKQIHNVYVLSASK